MTTHNLEDMGCGTSSVKDTRTEQVLKAALVIQNWYRGYSTRLKARQRYALTIFQSIEYADEQGQLQLSNFFSFMLENYAHIHEKDPEIVARLFGSTIQDYKDRQDYVAFVDVPNSYNGPRLQFPLTFTDIDLLVDAFKQQQILHARYVLEVLFETKKVLKQMPNFTHVKTSPSKEITICGDLHGKLDDLLLIFYKCEKENIGDEEVEDVETESSASEEHVNPPQLLTLRYPSCGGMSPFLPEGCMSQESSGILKGGPDFQRAVFPNELKAEESLSTMKRGFYGPYWNSAAAEGEWTRNGRVSVMVADAHCNIHSINDVVLIPGYIFCVQHTKPGVRLKREFALQMKSVLMPPTPLDGDPDTNLKKKKFNATILPREVKTSTSLSEQLTKHEWEQVIDILWSDPRGKRGCYPNTSRGGGCYFGPDITSKVLNRYQLKMLIRSHECKPEGYEICHDGKVITIFSASNYYEEGSNRGAYIKLSFGMAPRFFQYQVTRTTCLRPLYQRVNAIESSAIRILRERIIARKTDLIHAFQLQDRNKSDGRATSPKLEGMVSCLVVSYINCVCLVAFAGWLELWLAWAGGTGVPRSRCPVRTAKTEVDACCSVQGIYPLRALQQDR
uniref:serine/threonine-protein phosphatase with EF-hands 1 n=1 Tax=Panthera onca TaxID=9690 RepID=UPI00295328B9|nr:serine/threonine-protein phosphatase with EF-hands 1 [Panthera onca]